MKKCANSFAEHMFNIFQQICDFNFLNWKDYVVGQFYDKTSNMFGIYNGLQIKIKHFNPVAIFIWCYAHCLGLIITNAVSSSVNSVDTFGIIETIHDSSKKRVILFELCQEKCNGNKQ